MNVSIATQIPQAFIAAARTRLGHTAILPGAEYAGTVTKVQHVAASYWNVITIPARDAFRSVSYVHNTVTTQIWWDEEAYQWVVDYSEGLNRVEADRTRTLEAALSVASFFNGSRGHQRNLW